jgi:hypothetical protein
VIRKLKERKRIVTEKLQKLQASSKRELGNCFIHILFVITSYIRLDVEMKRRGIQSMENRIRYTTTEIRNKLEQIRMMENELEVLQSELHNIQVTCFVFTNSNFCILHVLIY